MYHEVVTELRDRGVTFTTVEPGDPLPEGTDVVLVGDDEEFEVAATAADEPVPSVHVVHASPDEPRRAVDAALAYLRGGEGRTVVGVDPGRKPGIAVLAGDTVVAAFQVPRDDAVAVVEAEVADAADPVVRVGDGARLDGAAIVNELEDVRVELVDETGTTPYLGTGARGMGDVLAAVNIARMEGEVVEERAVEPTAGELQVIKDRSREQSAENRAIDEVLARRVAAGELSIAEALERHGESDEE
nr:hypothetical protein [Haloarchaeobius salinus]